MGSCDRNRKHLNAYIDGELSERTRFKVERHLLECAVCRREFDDLHGLAPFLKKEEVPPMPAGLSSRILAEAAVLQNRKKTEKTSDRDWREFMFQPWLIRGMTTAALLIGLVTGTWLSLSSLRPPDSGQWAAMTNNENAVRNLYSFDVLSAEPKGSIEAATLALLDE